MHSWQRPRHPHWLTGTRFSKDAVEIYFIVLGCCPQGRHEAPQGGRQSHELVCWTHPCMLPCHSLFLLLDQMCSSTQASPNKLQQLLFQHLAPDHFIIFFTQKEGSTEDVNAAAQGVGLAWSDAVIHCFSGCSYMWDALRLRSQSVHDTVGWMNWMGVRSTRRSWCVCRRRTPKGDCKWWRSLIWPLIG